MERVAGIVAVLDDVGSVILGQVGEVRELVGVVNVEIRVLDLFGHQFIKLLGLVRLDGLDKALDSGAEFGGDGLGVALGGLFCLDGFHHPG